VVSTQKTATNALSDKDERTIVNLLMELPMRDGQILNYGFGCKQGAGHNHNVFHSSGFQLVRSGDISIKNIEDLARLSKKYYATLFVLNEIRGWIPDKDINTVELGSADLRELSVLKPAPASALRSMKRSETNLVTPEYLQTNAWLMITEGVCFKRNPALGEVEWSTASWDEFRAWRLGEPIKRA